VVLDGARVGEDCVLRECIVVPGATVASGIEAEAGTILS
jgi:ADP-glucose pyrophosphorylase